MDGSVYLVLFFLFVFVLIVIGAVVMQKKVKQDAEESARRFREAQEMKKIAMEKNKNRKEALKRTTSSLTFPHDHKHEGDEMDVYDAGFGSLGEIKDEGCNELIGIRLISHDKSYESDSDDNQIDYNLENIALTMILGEVLDKPKFKHPKN